VFNVPVNANAANGRLNLTILLNAAPMDPYATKLRAWDRALLLDSLASLLKQVGFKSVRVVAFNLDQQREVFRDSSFDQTSWSKLSTALRDLELGSVSYHVLTRQQGWSDLIQQLIREQINTAEPSDAVIFLGPTSRILSRIPREYLPREKGLRPRLFYLDYCAYWVRNSEFSDSLAHATRDLGGRIMRIHSPGELAKAIHEIQSDLSQ
jgi:hypothetical protein